MTQLPPPWPQDGQPGQQQGAEQGQQPGQQWQYPQDQQTFPQAQNWVQQGQGDTPWGTATAPPPGQGWAPPPRPGLVPLRPLTLGDTIGISFRAMRRNPMPTLGFALLTTAAGSVISVLPFILIAVSGGFSDGGGVPIDGAVTLGASFVVLAVVQLVVASLLQGIVAVDVSRGALGERLRLGGIFALLRGRVRRILGWSLALGLAVDLAIAILAALIALLAVAIGGAAGVGIAVVLGVLISLGFAVVAVWVGTKTCFTSSVIAVERLDIRAAVVRSWRLTRGRFWPVLGTNLLVSVIYGMAGQLISTVFFFVGSIVLGLVVGPDASDAAAVVTAVVVLYAVEFALALTVGALGRVAAAVTATTLYLDARMRREGFDLELRRFTEARAAGRSDAPDPFPAPRPQR